MVQVRSSHSKRSETDAATSRIRVVATYVIVYNSVEIIGDWPEPGLLARVEMRLPRNIFLSISVWRNGDFTGVVSTVWGGRVLFGGVRPKTITQIYV